ncbi:unnamed protein product [Orchesella dallaii]|uniref:Uncharacterized protein n=1 Tax=Orchesella dallaii TaxID=48710 RepID=A0ABP1R3I8_9HEXA
MKLFVSVIILLIAGAVNSNTYHKREAETDRRPIPPGRQGIRDFFRYLKADRPWFLPNVVLGKLFKHDMVLDLEEMIHHFEHNDRTPTKNSNKELIKGHEDETNTNTENQLERSKEFKAIRRICSELSNDWGSPSRWFWKLLNCNFVLEMEWMMHLSEHKDSNSELNSSNENHRIMNSNLNDLIMPTTENALDLQPEVLEGKERLCRSASTDFQWPTELLLRALYKCYYVEDMEKIMGSEHEGVVLKLITRHCRELSPVWWNPFSWGPMLRKGFGICPR